jgi:hypothetical protein
MDALLRGDRSGTVVDRVFVCGAQALGMLFNPDIDDTPAMVRFHAIRGQKALECAAEVFNGKDYMLKVHAATFIVPGYIVICLIQVALLYIQKGCDSIKAGNLQFIPTCGRPPEFSEDLHENLVALSQIIYWTNYLFLMRGGPEPRATAELEKEFRQELPVRDIASILSYIELIFYYSKLIRSSLRSALQRCGRKVSCLSGTQFYSSASSPTTVSVIRPPPQLAPAELSVPAPGIKLGFWRRSCDRIIASLEGISQTLLGNTKRFREYGDSVGADVIGSSCVACLAHLAILYEVVGRTDPVARVEKYDLCDSALQRLGILTSELRFEEYTYLDLLLGVRSSLCCFPMVMTQTGDRDRTLGINRSLSLTSA